jgi:hypothetical protein
MSLGRSVFALALAVSLSACGPPPPYVRYQGDVYQRKPKAVSEIDVLRGEPPETVRFQDLGTVIVTCPSVTEGGGGPSGYSAAQVGGCSYEWAIWSARQRAANVGADGIHTISTAVNGAGVVVNLTTSAFVYLPQHVATPAPTTSAELPASEPSESVEERLKRLEKLRADQLITPEEYAKKRAQILDDI